MTLETSHSNTVNVMDLRFPVPRHIVCSQLKLDAMFLMAKVNPSLSHNSDNRG